MQQLFTQSQSIVCLTLLLIGMHALQLSASGALLFFAGLLQSYVAIMPSASL